jgi:ESS family glutamate:Na+ symporter
LTGGPATGLAFAPLFEQAGIQGAATIAVTAGMVGIVAGGLLGGPIATLLIERGKLRPARVEAVPHGRVPAATDVVEAQVPRQPEPAPSGEDVGTYALLKGIVLILVAIWVGSYISRGFAAAGITLPVTVGGMLAGALVRNLDDVTGVIRVPQRLIEDLGNAALHLFIVIALMTLKLWDLIDLALPLAAILMAQVALIAVLCVWPIPRVMGRDYEAAVSSAGFCGFMLGTTANAMANMVAVAERYGPAPRSFLVVPLVGACFIDFANALLVTGFLNWWD